MGGSGTLSGAFFAARGREAGEVGVGAVAADTEAVRLSSNENPLGPGKKAMDAILANFDQTGRYPFNSRLLDRHLKDAVAKMYGAKSDNVVLGAGSGEILRNATRAFTSASAAVVTAHPSFATCAETAKQIGSPVKYVELGATMQIDLDKMAEAAKGAGLVFFCNPNNPSATVHGAKAVADFVTRVRKESPSTFILIDEAYHDYVTDPNYHSAYEIALSTPNVFIARTFSKAYGMAGMRSGYAVGQPETIKQLARFSMPYNNNVPVVAAAIASLEDQAHIAEERERNTAARKFTLDFFKTAGFKATDSQTNFIFVNLGRPAKEFRDACAQHNVVVGRDFPPLEKTWSRISIGTMDEMKKATAVFAKVLGTTTTTSASRP
ncbi:MAG: histidinol-phosphate transaminase [Vicinamibacterales bacterium]